MVIHEKTLELLKANRDWDFKKPDSLNDFTAKLYGYELTVFKNQWNEENLNTILLENAIALYPKECLCMVIPHFILDEIRKDGTEPTFRDRVILHAIYNANGRHNMDYYVSKANEFSTRFALEISEYNRLKEMEVVYLKMDERLSDAFLAAKNGHWSRIPGKKPLASDDCPHAEEDLRDAWLNGYGCSYLEEVLFNKLLQL